MLLVQKLLAPMNVVVILDSLEMDFFVKVHGNLFNVLSLMRLCSVFIERRESEQCA